MKTFLVFIGILVLNFNAFTQDIVKKNVSVARILNQDPSQIFALSVVAH